MNIYAINETPLSLANLEIELDKFWTNQKTISNFMPIYYQALAKTLGEADIVIVTTVSAPKL